VSLHVVSALPPSSTPQTEHLINLPQLPRSDIIWPSPAHPDLYAVQNYNPRNYFDALAIHRIFPPHSQSDSFYLGETEDALAIVDLHSKTGEFAVSVASGMDTRVDIVNRAGKPFTLYATDKCAGFRAFDVKKVGDEYVMACILSSGPKKEPPNIWTGRIRGQQRVCVACPVACTYPLMSHTAHAHHQAVRALAVGGRS
jgi:hypothetical protein